MDCDEDEFELMHAQEVEMLREMEEEFEPPENPPPSSKRSLDFDIPEVERSKNCPSTSVENVQNSSSLVCNTKSQSVQIGSSSEILGDFYPLQDGNPTVEDLFGDIQDIDFCEQNVKRPRFDFEITTEQKQGLLIKRILERRHHSNISSRQVVGIVEKYSEYRP